MLLVKAAPQEASELGVSTDDQSELKEVVNEYSINDMLRIQNLLVELEQKIRDGFDPRINLELALLKLVNMESSITLEQILKQLADSPQKPSARPGPMAESKKKELKLTSPAPAPTKPEANPTTNTAVAPPPDLDVGDLWQSLLADLKRSHRSLQIKLTMAEPRNIEGDKIMVAFDNLGEFHVRQLQERDTRLLLRSDSGKSAAMI